MGIIALEWLFQTEIKSTKKLPSMRWGPDLSLGHKHGKIVHWVSWFASLYFYIFVSLGSISLAVTVTWCGYMGNIWMTNEEHNCEAHLTGFWKQHVLENIFLELEMLIFHTQTSKMFPEPAKGKVKCLKLLFLETLSSQLKQPKYLPVLTSVRM